jgi:hypothetical protein
MPIELYVDGRYRPGHVARFTFADAAAGSVTVDSIDIATVAGGTSGSTLWLYEGEAFVPVATNAGPATAPATLNWSSTDATQLPGLFTGPRKDLAFAITPTSPNGTGLGMVSVDAVTVTVTYSRP